MLTELSPGAQPMVDSATGGRYDNPLGWLQVSLAKFCPFSN